MVLHEAELSVRLGGSTPHGTESGTDATASGPIRRQQTRQVSRRVRPRATPPRVNANAAGPCTSASRSRVRGGAAMLALDVAIERWQETQAREDLGTLIHDAFTTLEHLATLR